MGLRGQPLEGFPVAAAGGYFYVAVAGNVLSRSRQPRREIEHSIQGVGISGERLHLANRSVIQVKRKGERCGIGWEILQQGRAAIKFDLRGAALQYAVVHRQSVGCEFNIRCEAVPMQPQWLLFSSAGCNAVDHGIEVVQFQMSRESWLPELACHGTVEGGASVHSD